MRAELPLLLSLLPRPRKSGRAFSARPRLAFRKLGLMELARRCPKTPSSPGLFPEGLVEVSPRLTLGRPRQPTRLGRRPTPCSAASLRPCAMPQQKLTTWSECKLGAVNPPAWHDLRPQPTSHARSGTMP